MKEEGLLGDQQISHQTETNAGWKMSAVKYQNILVNGLYEFSNKLVKIS